MLARSYGDHSVLTREVLYVHIVICILSSFVSSENKLEMEEWLPYIEPMRNGSLWANLHTELDRRTAECIHN